MRRFIEENNLTPILNKKKGIFVSSFFFFYFSKNQDIMHDFKKEYFAPFFIFCWTKDNENDFLLFYFGQVDCFRVS